VLVKALQMAQAALVDLFDPVEMPLNEHGALDRLDDGGPTLRVRGLEIREIEGAADVSPVQLRVDGGEPAEEVVARVAGLVVLSEAQDEAGADGGEAGLFELVGDEKSWKLGLLLRLRPSALRTRLLAAGRTPLRMRFGYVEE